jgi:hypothetical protein
VRLGRPRPPLGVRSSKRRVGSMQAVEMLDEGELPMSP